MKHAKIVLSATLVAGTTPVASQAPRGIGPNMDMRVARTVERCAVGIIAGFQDGQALWATRIIKYNREGIELSYRDDKSRPCARAAAPARLPTPQSIPISPTPPAKYVGSDAQGWNNDRHFVHPNARVRFEFPTGYTVQNYPAEVVINGPQGRGRFAGALLAGPLEAHAQKLLADIVKERVLASGPRTRSLIINGLTAVRVDGTVNVTKGQVDVTVVAIATSPTKAYHFFGLTAPGSTEYDVMYTSFRLMTDSDVDNFSSVRQQR